MASMAILKLGSKSEVFQRQGQTWNCTTGLPSDIIVEVGDVTFNLHKFPLLSRSGKLDKMIADASAADGSTCTIQLPDLPGGAKTFELVARFCYGVKLELSALNIVSLRCAAELLLMSEDYGEGNLITQTETFLGELFGSWKDSLKILETCEEVLPLAEDLRIVSRCINSLAAKAHADPALFSLPMEPKEQPVTSPGSGSMWNGIVDGDMSKMVSAGDDWWFEDVCVLRLPMYKAFISAVESRGVKPELIAGSLMAYAQRHLAGLNRHNSNGDGSSGPFVTGGATVTDSDPVAADFESDQRTLLEEIAGLLPLKRGVASAKHLLGLLRFSAILKASAACRENLEKRVGAQLDEAALEDLLMPNLDHSAETLYDVDCVQRILDHYLLLDQAAIVASPVIDDGQLLGTSPTQAPLAMVAKLIDGYLAEVAPDSNLKFVKFHNLAAAIPDSARPLDDGLYRAIDMYLKAHPALSELEREQLCHLMNCQKLSLEACTHAAQNERLPLRVVVQVLFFEQLRLRTSIAGWFFVSDNLENPRGNVGLRKREASGEPDARRTPGPEDVKTRVAELEKECAEMRTEIKKLTKNRRWSAFMKKLGLQSITPSFCDGNDVPVNCVTDQSKKSLL